MYYTLVKDYSFTYTPLGNVGVFIFKGNARVDEDRETILDGVTVQFARENVGEIVSIRIAGEFPRHNKVADDCLRDLLGGLLYAQMLWATQQSEPQEQIDMISTECEDFTKAVRLAWHERLMESFVG